MIAPEYTRDEETRVWRRAGAGGIPYSDGNTVEAGIREALESCRDLSVGSEELALQIRDWPTEYHFGAARANLVRALGIDAGLQVLELGCGCGAITRALGETGAHVTAVDGSLRRAAAAASRCRDLPNVTVVHDTIAELRTSATFDVVTLIGVLEYAPLFFEGPDPVRRCLERAVALLKPGGRLVVAIENQLGLKYFAGCGEDHVGRPHFGIQDLYGPGTPVTFGRQELRGRLRDAGLPVVECVYPFPDYKLPTVLIGDAALGVEGFRAADLLVRLQSRDYQGSPLRAFDEALAWQALERNGLIGELANSFLMVGRRTGPTQPEPWLARVYSIDRRPRYMTETDIVLDEGALRVRKRLLNPPASTAPSPVVSQHLGLVPYEAGSLLITDLYRILQDDFDLDRVAAWATPWIAYLRTQAGGEPAPGHLPGSHLDCVPFNLVRDAHGLRYIDAEWEWHRPVPLHWVLIRGLAYATTHWLLTDQHPDLTVRQFVAEIARRVGVPLEPRHFDEAIALEDAFQREVRVRVQGGFADHLDARLGRYVAAFGPTAMATQFQATQAELARIKSSLSWQVTKPLRLLTNLLRGRL